MASPAIAQTASEHANEWTEARRGDRDWTQRATEQLTTGLTERLMGRPPTGPMKEAANYILSEVERLRTQVRNPCLAAAVEQAHSQVLATGRQKVMSGAFEMLTGALQNASGGSGVAEFLGKTLTRQIGEKLRGDAFDRFKAEMRDAMKRGLPDYWSDSNNSDACKVEYRGVWDKAAERYYFLIAGDCACNLVGCGPNVGGQARLRRWTVEGWGTIVPEFEQRANGDKVVRFSVGRPQDVSVTADCCGRDEPSFRTFPADGPGDAWVGFLRPPPAQTPSTPVSRPQTGGDTQAPTAATPVAPATTRARPVRVEVPQVPDGPMSEAELEALGERVSAAHERAQAAREQAYNRLDELQDNGAPQADIDQAQTDLDETEAIRRRARAALEKVLDKFKDQGNGEGQSSIVPPEQLDPGSGQMLAMHNRARAEAGVPALNWDSELAAAAGAYADHLANGVPYVHAGRIGREDQRENLSMGYLGASGAQMMGNWLAEKRNFRAGIFPDISSTGDWKDAGHYSQMIWPTTTRVGCGTANSAKWAYLVCRYSPPGNKDGAQVP